MSATAEPWRDQQRVSRLASQLRAATTQPWTIMEVCGGQTHSILRHGLDQLLPAKLDLIHGPGCPVCVTPPELIDAAIELAMTKNAALATFGDMIRVPGTDSSLLEAKARGADVRIVYSPLDALTCALDNPDKEVIFFAVGFETTTPATALTIKRADAANVSNFSMLTAHVLVPPALTALLDASNSAIDGFLAAGHVCTVMGTTAYEAIAHGRGVPIVATGFEPVDIMEGLLMTVRQLEEGRCEVETQYRRAVAEAGNEHARALVDDVFEPVDRSWRGIGVIPASGLQLRQRFARFDAMKKIKPTPIAQPAASSEKCQAGRILLGQSKPKDCPAFATRCTPETPLGAPMVSSEGACAAYYRYGQVETASQ